MENVFLPVLPHSFVFKGNLVRLRPFEKGDAATIAAKINHFETLLGIGRPLPISLHDEEDFVDFAIRETRGGRSIFYVVEENLEAQIVGSVSLKGINTRNRTAELGIAIFEPKNFNKGYGTEATKLILKVAFTVLNLNRVELNVFEYNARAKHVYEKVGFKEIGKRRQFMYYGGKYYDSYLMDVLAEEYFSKFGKEEILKI